MNARTRRSRFRRRTSESPPTESAPDDVATALPSARPRVVLIELPAAVFDLTPLRDHGFSEGPIGLAGAAVLETLACAGRRLDDSSEFDRVFAEAVAAGIFAGDLDHEWNEADPDGHYDNTWLRARYRTDGFVLNLLESLRPYSDALPALTTLRSMNIRPVAIPFLGASRTTTVLGPELAGMLELPDAAPAESLANLLSTTADTSGVVRSEVSAMTATTAMTSAAMAAGLGTVWIDRVGQIRNWSYDGQTGKSRNYRWGSPPTPVIVDDLPAAVRFLSDLRAHP